MARSSFLRPSAWIASSVAASRSRIVEYTGDVSFR
jgi:hypothetical protein